MRFTRAVLLAVLASTLAPSLSAEVQTFDAPEHDGYLVSSCASANGVCGEQVAHYWCRRQGFERAVDWAVQAGRDFSTATVTLDAGAICRGAQCESFASISCETQGRRFRMPALGGLARSTLITPDRRSTEPVLATVEYDVQLPGCHQREPGVFTCETVPQYRQCRTLLRAGRVFGCRAGLAFDDALAEPIAVDADGYELGLESTAEVVVDRGRRGEGRTRGEVRFEIAFAMPDINRLDWCVQRDRYIYFPTGPKGGLAEIGATDDCDAPLEGRFAPHEDDLIGAYDMCEGTQSWGDDIEHDMEVLVGALLHIASNRPDFVPTRGRTRIIAPYVQLRAPLSVRCRD